MLHKPAAAAAAQLLCVAAAQLHHATQAGLPARAASPAHDHHLRQIRGPSPQPGLCVQLPASFFAYRKQQHRWTCGPVQLWRKAAQDIWTSGLPLGRKLELILCYFGLRKVATHWVSLGFFCTLVPLSVFTPEVSPPAPALAASQPPNHPGAKAFAGY